jgi:hypothetical protein
MGHPKDEVLPAFAEEVAFPEVFDHRCAVLGMHDGVTLAEHQSHKAPFEIGIGGSAT